MTCAFVTCSEAETCALGGCIQEDERFQQAERLVEPSDLRDNARALAGTQARATRDPRLIQRRRKALTR